MMKNGEIPYKFARKSAGMTAEALADALYYGDVNAIRNFERGRTHPKDDVVARMAAILNAPWLPYEHIRHISTIAAEMLPPIELGNASESFVRMSKEAEDVRIREHEIKTSLCNGFNGNASDLAREAWEAAEASIAFATAIST